MVVDRASRDDEPVGDLGVSETFGQEGEYVELASCEVCRADFVMRPCEVPEEGG
jgi:hypothetical protein